MKPNAELTEQSFAARLKPLTLLPNAPALDAELLAFLVGLFRGEQVSPEDLSAGVVEVVKTATFWPAPAELLKASCDARDRRLAPDRLDLLNLHRWLDRRHAETRKVPRGEVIEFAKWAISEEAEVDERVAKASRKYLALRARLEATGRLWPTEAEQIRSFEMSRGVKRVTG